MSVRKSLGFSLVELLTAITILAVLAAIAVPAFKDLRINSQISAISGDMVSSLNRARSLAISTRTPVYLIRGAGTGTADVAAGDDWSKGWRMSRGLVMAASVQQSRTLRSGNNNDVRVLVTDGAVDAAGTTAGAVIDGFAFNNFGQLITTNGLALAQVAIVICAPDVTNERGRVLTLNRVGRIINTTVSNPVSCGS